MSTRNSYHESANAGRRSSSSNQSAFTVMVSQFGYTPAELLVSQPRVKVRRTRRANTADQDALLLTVALCSNVENALRQINPAVWLPASAPPLITHSSGHACGPFAHPV